MRQRSKRRFCADCARDSISRLRRLHPAPDAIEVAAHGARLHREGGREAIGRPGAGALKDQPPRAVAAVGHVNPSFESRRGRLLGNHKGPIQDHFQAAAVAIPVRQPPLALVQGVSPAAPRPVPGRLPGAGGKAPARPGPGGAVPPGSAAPGGEGPGDPPPGQQFGQVSFQGAGPVQAGL